MTRFLDDMLIYYNDYFHLIRYNIGNASELLTPTQLTNLRIPKINRDQLRCSGRVGSSCSHSATRRVTNPVTSHGLGKDSIVITTNCYILTLSLCHGQQLQQCCNRRHYCQICICSNDDKIEFLKTINTPKYKVHKNISTFDCTLQLMQDCFALDLQLLVTPLASSSLSFLL